jgi:hypothetical protein
MDHETMHTAVKRVCTTLLCSYTECLVAKRSPRCAFNKAGPI